MAQVLSDCTSMSASDFPQPFTTTGAATATGVAAHKPERDATAETRRVLLDVCCGAGTLGLVLARQCGCSQVLGVETCAPAVKDARLNASVNGLEDISTYACGPAETKIDELLATGTLDRLERERADPLTKGLSELQRVSGIGEKRVFKDSRTHVLPAPPTPKIKNRYSF